MTSPSPRIKMDAQGLLPAVLQDASTGQVLMLGYMNELALQLTLETGQVHFWSRSRNQLWHKGATSGNFQEVVDLSLDCDGDALLVRVHPVGPTCHTGQVSCFHNSLDALEGLHDD
jgi:phosphoribosyl-AMP cyclohydrolase